MDIKDNNKRHDVDNQDNNDKNEDDTKNTNDKSTRVMQASVGMWVRASSSQRSSARKLLDGSLLG